MASCRAAQSRADSDGRRKYVFRLRWAQSGQCLDGNRGVGSIEVGMSSEFNLIVTFLAHGRIYL